MGYYSRDCLSVYPKYFGRGWTRYRQLECRLGTKFDTELTKKIDFNASYVFYIVNEKSGKYTHNVRAALEIELTRRLDLDLSFVWDRIQDPKPKDDGQVPDRDDFYFFFGIGFEL